MARTPSTMIPLGTPAPDFRLPDTDGRTVARDDFDAAPALLVMFICNHCPYVVHVRDRLSELVRGWQAPMAQWFEGVGATLREVIDLDLEEGFVEMLRSARQPVAQEVA